MAKPNKPYHLIVPTTLFFLIICQFSSARPLMNNGFAATGLPLDLAPPGDNRVVSPENQSEKDSSQHVLPCHEVDSIKNYNTEVVAPKRLRGKYGPLVLNILPKGTVPPSGPSKRINNINN